MSETIKIKKDITIKEFIEILSNIENQDSIVTVPDSERYGSDTVKYLDVFEDMIVIN